MIEILRAGISTSIQDLGRYGFRSAGVPLAGAMDLHANFIANSLLGNEGNFATIECCMQGPKIVFSSNTRIAYFGADVPLKLNGKLITSGKVYSIINGDILDVGFMTGGIYGYLAIAGGIQSDVVLGSRSFSAFVTEKTRLNKGDVLSYASVDQHKVQSTSIPFKRDNSNVFSCHYGPEYDQLSSQMKTILSTKEFIISNDISRVGVRLESTKGLEGKGITSSAIMPGTIQLTPSGNLIAMMRDCPVTGGYTRVLQLEEKEINRLAQKRPASKISFSLSLPLQQEQI